jgi:hypothetical protein
MELAVGLTADAADPASLGWALAVATAAGLSAGAAGSADISVAAPGAGLASLLDAL